MKESIDGACFMLRRRVFQRVGAALAKSHFPNVSSRHLGEWRRYWSSKRRGRGGTYFDISATRYCGTWPISASQVRRRILQLIPWSTWSQYSSFKTMLAWSNLCLLDIILASLFWQHCSRSMWDCFTIIQARCYGDIIEISSYLSNRIHIEFDISTQFSDLRIKTARRIEYRT